MSAERLWQAALGQLQMELPRATFDTWVRDAELLAYEDGTYIIGIKYTPDSTIGLTNPGTVTYSFSTSINGALVFSSQDSILLKQK